VRSGVYEVSKACECGGEAHGWSVQSCNENLGVSVEGVCDVQVLSHKALEVVALDIDVFWWCF
jgi:hypothetical protein